MAAEHLKKTAIRPDAKIYTSTDSPDRRAVISKEGGLWKVNIQRKSSWWQAEQHHEHQPRYRTLEEAEAAASDVLTSQTCG